MLDQNTLLRIKKIAVAIDHEKAFKGKSRGNRHLFRVVRIAEFLAKKTGADISISIAGAWLHDTALPSGNDYNYKKNREIVKKLLKNIKISAGTLERIAECVGSHEGTATPKTLEAKVVHDADVIEKLGILGVIRHTWKLVNSDKINPAMVTDRDVKKVISHIQWRQKRLQTPVGKKMGKYLQMPLSAQKTKSIVSITSSMAVEGIITEKIALALRKELTSLENKKLREQLNLEYLARFN